MSRTDDIPDWAMEEAASLRSAVVWQSNSANETIARSLVNAARRGRASERERSKAFKGAAEEAYWLLAWTWQSHLTGPGKPFDMSIFAPEARDMMTKAEQDLFDAMSEIEP